MNRLRQWRVGIFFALLVCLLSFGFIIQFEGKHFPIDDPYGNASTVYQRHIHCRDNRIVRSYAYSMPADKRLALIKKINELKIGENKQDVSSVLGVADLSENLYRRGRRFLFSVGSVKIGRFPSSWKYGSQLVFVFDRSQLGEFYCGDDRYAALLFNNDDKLVIIDSNISDISERPKAPAIGD